MKFIFTISAKRCIMAIITCVNQRHKNKFKFLVNKIEF